MQDLTPSIRFAAAPEMRDSAPFGQSPYAAVCRQSLEAKPDMALCAQGQLA